MTTTRRRWPTAASAARRLAMRNLERQIHIYRELLREPKIYGDNKLARMIYEAMALAEQALRELAEVKPYPDDEAPSEAPAEGDANTPAEPHI